MIADLQDGWERQWPGGYTENFVVAEPQLGVSEKEIVKHCIDPFVVKEGNAVEIGCGTGDAWSEKYLCQRFRYVTGVDVIRREWVITDKSPKNFGYIQVAPNDYSLSMIEDETVDFVWSFGCLGHLPRVAVRQYIEAAFRVLKPDGDACFEFFATTRRMDDVYPEDAPVNLGMPGTYVMREDEPRLMLEDAGFEMLFDCFPKSKTVLITAHKAI